MSALRKIGTAKVPAIGFGAMGLGRPVGTKIEKDDERLKVLDAAHEKGCTHWDTAAVYQDSEDLIGEWFKRTGKRNEIFLATKLAFSQSSTTGVGVLTARGDPEFVKEACAKSLKRLGVDYIDLYYIHRTDPNTPIELTIGAMAELLKEGKIKNIGISECTAKDLRRAHAVHPIAALQVEYNPFLRHIEDEQVGLLKAARELGVTIVTFSPLARGLVTGQYKSPDDFPEGDIRRTIPKYSRENFPRILKVSEKIAEVGKAHQASPGQVTLAWILEQGEDFVIIPGTQKIKYLEENLGAGKVKLSREEVDAITKIANEASDIPGARYGDAHIHMVQRDTAPLSSA